MADVTMPKLSDTMEEGKILRWLKQAGDHVEVGDLLVEVETDKADMEVEASAAGVLREVKLGEGASAPVGAVIAIIDAGSDGATGARPAAAAKQDGAARVPREQAAAPVAATDAPSAPIPPASTRPLARTATAPPGIRDAGPKDSPALAQAVAAASARAGHEVKVSPLARALAEELGVDLTTVRGTGPAGRVTRRDVEEAQARAGTPRQAEPVVSRSDGAAAARAPERVPERASEDDAQEPARAPGVRRVPLSRMRASIAKRMAESKREAPHFYLTTVVDMEDAVRLRAQLKALEASPAGVTYNHMVVKAVADALAAFPEVNARFAGEVIEILDEINIGIATAVDDGLIVPVLPGADRLSLLEVAAQARALAEKAEGGRFTSADLSGASFSVSNLGMFDVDSFSAVINPPQAAILAVGSVKQRPVVRAGELAVAHTMSLTLSCDHRVIDGALGGRFLADVKRRLENPAGLLLGAVSRS